MPRRLPVAALTLATALITLLALIGTPVARAATSQESMFQDDPLLVYGDEVTQKRTLDRLVHLGVDRIRVSVFWRIVAPANDAAKKPDGFNAADPAAYPSGAWDRYDRLIVAAKNRGIRVNLNITSPVPDWAAGNPERADLKPTYAPDAGEFARFVAAVGTRYSGRYGGLPRVDYWSIWNEPNQPGWLTPQWLPDKDAPGGFADAAPRIYRDLANAMWFGLSISGHAGDTILVGETAPKGQARARGVSRAMKPRRFLLRLYCLDDNAQVLKGAEAKRNQCPGKVDGFREANPGLFQVTGLAHHPYELTRAPDVEPEDPEFFTTGNLRALGSLMGRVFLRYGAAIPGDGKGGFPLYLTEYGYQTDPPDPTGVSRARQAAYLNQAEWITARNRAVKTLSQFLLFDDKPVEGATKLQQYGATFQSGLSTDAGRRKPAYAAYRFPIHVRRTTINRGSLATVWGLLRAGRPKTRETVRIEGRPSGAKRYRTLRTVRADALRGYLQARVRLRRTTRVRLSWRDPRTKSVQRSRSVTIKVRQRRR
ncbi:cellulase family glycosylhydrolase [Paraconexibacter sp.]|uniref:cellulase family glycosylhydrolase n=1 Tax=Paraconexibacter sp. TaxID=2949640 RepID=UPI0035647339